MKKQFSLIVSVPKDSKVDKWDNLVVKGVQLIFALVHFKKVHVEAILGEFDGDETTHETMYTFSW